MTAPSISAVPGLPGTDALIGLDDVTKRYGGDATPAVDGVSMQIAPGESVAVMGPSGSGKSTLLNMIAGLDRPTSGTVTVAGERIDRLSETGVARFRRRQVGMIFQFFNLLDDLTVLDNILLPAQLAGVPRGKARARAIATRCRWPTSRPAHWTPPPARRSANCCSTSTGPARRWCSSPTTPTWPRGTPAGRSSSPTAGSPAT